MWCDQGCFDHTQLAHLTPLLERIAPAIKRFALPLESHLRSGDNMAFVNAVARQHVLETIQEIRQSSDVLRKLETDANIKIIPAMYHVENGVVEWL